MTGKQKATAIGATTGGVAGALVGGPIGAVVGAGVGGCVGRGRTHGPRWQSGEHGQQRQDVQRDHVVDVFSPADVTVKDAQAALEQQGYNPGSIDGQMGPNSRNALMRFQQDKGLTPSGNLDGATLSALGVPR